ncbi:hypothetical protein LCGC14_1947330, partial [marine sediment metagenome]
VPAQVAVAPPVPAQVAYEATPLDLYELEQRRMMLQDQTLFYN